MTPTSAGDEMIAIVLGGGRGTRLYPLTKYRSKPAVPLAGKYRLIDVPISNCIHSGIRKIYVLTQFNSASLNRHVALTYKFDAFSEGFVEILAAEQTLETERWYQGTADAVRRNLIHVLDSGCKHVLILSGDALHRQDFSLLLQEHKRNGADVSVVCKLVNERDAEGFGIVGIDEARRILSFHEKPKGEALHPLKVDPDVVKRAGLRPNPATPYLASMGIYLFRRDVLVEVLQDTSAEDFGKQVIPRAIESRRVFASLFDRYWEDIGTIRSFFQANLDLLEESPPFTFYDSAHPIYTHCRLLPSSLVTQSHLERTMLAEGCRVRRAELKNCVVGIRSIIDEGARLENVVMMGADYYDGGVPSGAPPDGVPPIGIGRDVVVRNAIIDKNARIGEGARILNESGAGEIDTDMYSIRDGVIIIPKNAVVPPGTVI